jgi:predicted heme/steroid binding protein
MSILSGATAYALGQVAISQMSSGGSLMNLDLEWAKQAYQEAYERGKDVASKLEKEKDSSKHVIETLEKLGELKEKGVITEAEFEAQKEKLLDRL